MRPINLTISGINSYNKAQTINFKRLSEGNLFGIFGATGSGKSTILDSVIMALYGVSGDRGKSSDIINVNLKDAQIIFEFELEDKGVTTLYEVTRKFKIRPSGFKSEAYLINQETNEVLGDTTDKVNATIVKLLGINKAEFIKCVALPQNEFDKFLLDTPADRKKSVAKLFNLEKFGEHLNKKLKEKKDGLEKEEATLKAKLSILSDLNIEKQQELQGEIDNLRRLIKKYELEVKDLETRVKQLEVVCEKRQQLQESQENLNKINLLKTDYDKLKLDLENYEKSREQLIAYNTFLVNSKKLDEINDKQKTAKIELKENSRLLQQLLVNLNNLRQDDKLLNAKQKDFEIAFEKSRLLQNQINESENTLAKLEINKKELFEQQNTLLAQEREGIVRYDKLNIQLKNAIKVVNNNEELLQQINNIIMISKSEDFVKQLKYVKSCINLQDALEVKQYKIYTQIQKALEAIDSIEANLNLTLNERDGLIKSLKTTIPEVPQLAIKLNEEQKIAKENLKKLESDVEKSNLTKAAYSYQLQNIYKELNKIKNEILEINKKINKLKKGEAITLKDNSEQIVNNNREIKKMESREQELNTKINNLEKNLDVYKVEIEYISKENSGLKNKIPDNFSGELLLQINEDNYQIKHDKLAEYIKNKDYCENRIKILTKELAGKDYVEILPFREKLANLKELLNNCKIDYGIKDATYKENAKKLNEQKEVGDKYEAISKELTIILKLHSLLSQNALIHFVSEEYLYLISQYANEFIKKITRGKYMFKYVSDNSGEFIVVDNFNAGAERSIKSLSGGERFIFSLGLALGISQSIAVNNNKQFNFFFIDEGFGSLSDDFVDDILQCFDGLIKLDFTIGFISHVEKMKEYINNKVIVTKDDIDEGSVITQYF